MFKLKTLLLLSILPLAYLIYHLIGFENGINAYVYKIKELKNKQKQQEELKKEIDEINQVNIPEYNKELWSIGIGALN